MKIKVALAALLMVALAGCGSASPGNAAVVDGTAIKIDDLNTATQQLSLWNGGAVDPQTVLYFLVAAPKTIAAASQAGVGVSVADATSALSTKISDPSPAAVQMLQGYAAQQRISQLPETEAKKVLDQLAADLRASQIVINPRYGRLEPTTLQPSAPLENWLYQPDGGATATPEPTPASTPTP